MRSANRSSATARFLRLGAVAVLALHVAACSPVIEQHGHRITEEALAQIRPGVTSREEVARLLGTPSSLAAFEDGRWYYITQRTERTSFYQAEVTQQDVLTVEFDDAGIVTRIGERGLEQAMNIEPASDTTPTMGNEFSLVEQLIGNIGRFNTSGADTPGQTR